MNANKAKQTADDEPITNVVTPTHVLLAEKDNYHLLGNTETVADMLEPENADVDFEPIRTANVTPREIDLS